MRSQGWRPSRLRRAEPAPRGGPKSLLARATRAQRSSSRVRSVRRGDGSHGARSSHLSHRRDAVLLRALAGSGVVESLSVVATTGGYLARWYEGYLVPSRSTVFGLFLHFGEGLHFWPELVLQTACA